MFTYHNLISSADMEYIDIRGTTQENIAKEIEEIAARRGMKLEFQVFPYTIESNVMEFQNSYTIIKTVPISLLGYLAFP